MRTNIDIDDDLLAEAMRATGLKTKKATVEAGLRRLAQGNRYAEMLALQGKVEFWPDYNHKALREDRPLPDAAPSPAPADTRLAGRRA